MDLFQELFNAKVYNDLNKINSLLILHKDHINDQNMDGWTPLHQACYFGFEDLIESLVIHGADVNVRDKFEYTPLFYLCSESKLDMIKFLLNYGADINIQSNLKWTILHRACFCGYIKIIELLLNNNNANINLKTNDGKSIFNLAKQNGNDNIIFLLYQKVLWDCWSIE